MSSPLSGSTDLSEYGFVATEVVKKGKSRPRRSSSSQKKKKSSKKSSKKPVVPIRVDPTANLVDEFTDTVNFNDFGFHRKEESSLQLGDFLLVSPNVDIPSGPMGTASSDMLDPLSTHCDGTHLDLVDGNHCLPSVFLLERRNEPGVKIPLNPDGDATVFNILRNALKDLCSNKIGEMEWSKKNKWIIEWRKLRYPESEASFGNSKIDDIDKVLDCDYCEDETPLSSTVPREFDLKKSVPVLSDPTGTVSNLTSDWEHVGAGSAVNSVTVDTSSYNIPANSERIYQQTEEIDITINEPKVDSNSIVSSDVPKPGNVTPIINSQTLQKQHWSKPKFLPPSSRRAKRLRSKIKNMPPTKSGDPPMESSVSPIYTASQPIMLDLDPIENILTEADPKVSPFENPINTYESTIRSLVHENKWNCDKAVHTVTSHIGTQTSWSTIQEETSQNVPGVENTPCSVKSSSESAELKGSHPSPQKPLSKSRNSTTSSDPAFTSNHDPSIAVEYSSRFCNNFEKRDVRPCSFSQSSVCRCQKHFNDLHVQGHAFASCYCRPLMVLSDYHQITSCCSVRNPCLTSTMNFDQPGISACMSAQPIHKANSVPACQHACKPALPNASRTSHPSNSSQSSLPTCMPSQSNHSFHSLVSSFLTGMCARPIHPSTAPSSYFFACVACHYTLVSHPMAPVGCIYENFTPSKMFTGCGRQPMVSGTIQCSSLDSRGHSPPSATATDETAEVSADCSKEVQAITDSAEIHNFENLSEGASSSCTGTLPVQINKSLCDDDLALQESTETPQKTGAATQRNGRRSEANHRALVRNPTYRSPSPPEVIRKRTVQSSYAPLENAERPNSTVGLVGQAASTIVQCGQLATTIGQPKLSAMAVNQSEESATTTGLPRRSSSTIGQPGRSATSADQHGPSAKVADLGQSILQPQRPNCNLSRNVIESADFIVISSDDDDASFTH